MPIEKNLDTIAEMLTDEALRKDIIAFLADEFPKDFLVPVRIDFDAFGDAGGSCKEWQE